MDLNNTMDFNQFKKKYQNAEVKEINENQISSPLISICVQTYNHANYIEKCLDSLLDQQTSFNYEILIGEDQSSDGTREICQKYAEAYPDKIRLFLHDRANNIKINGRPTGRFNWLYNLYSARGKYIALCEGDDYWIDSSKLQKQVDVLQKEKEVIACFTNARIEQDRELQTYNETYRKAKRGDEYFSFDRIALKGGGLFPTASFVFRNTIKEFPDFMVQRQSGDRALSLLLASAGEFKYLDEVTCVYRVHAGGLFSGGLKDKSRRNRIYKDNIELLKSFDLHSNGKFHSAISKAISLQAKKVLLGGNFKNHLDLFSKLSFRDTFSLCKNFLSS